MSDALDRLEARAAIADLVHGYALAIRRDRPEDVAALFAPDGTFEVRVGAPDKAQFTTRSRFDDPGALVAYLLPGKGGPHPIPQITNLLIEVDGDIAHASSLMYGPIPGTSRKTFGEYADSFTKTQGRWLFSARVYTLYDLSD